MWFITESTTCGIVMSFCVSAANSAKFIHKGLLTPFTRSNGIFTLSKPEIKSTWLWS